MQAVIALAYKRLANWHLIYLLFMEATFKSYNYGNKIKMVILVLIIKCLKKFGNYMFKFIQTFPAVLLVMVLQHYILILFVIILIKR